MFDRSGALRLRKHKSKARAVARAPGGSASPLSLPLWAVQLGSTVVAEIYSGALREQSPEQRYRCVCWWWHDPVQHCMGFHTYMNACVSAWRPYSAIRCAAAVQ